MPRHLRLDWSIPGRSITCSTAETGGNQSSATKPTGGGYVRTVCEYVPLNPARAKLLGPEHYGEERAEGQEEKAERVVAEELRRRKWRGKAWQERAKGDPEKVKIAVRLRKETLVTVAWIAQRLQMGSVAHVNTLLCQSRRKGMKH